MSNTINKTDNSKAIPVVKAPDAMAVTPSAKTKEAGERFSTLVALARSEQQGTAISRSVNSEAHSKTGDAFEGLVAASKQGPEDVIRSEQQVLGEVASETQQVLQGLAEDKDGFHSVLEQSFGGQYDKGEAEALRQQMLEGDFSWAPKVRLVDFSQLGDTSGTQQFGQGLAAYSKTENTIYIDRELVTNDPAQAKAVLLEELGHAIDARINTNDAQGDEGAIFAKLVSGEKISAAQMKALKSENDSGTIKIDGKEIEVEYYRYSGVGSSPMAGGSSRKSTPIQGFTTPSPAPKKSTSNRSSYRSPVASDAAAAERARAAAAARAVAEAERARAAAAAREAARVAKAKAEAEAAKPAPAAAPKAEGPGHAYHESAKSYRPAKSPIVGFTTSLPTPKSLSTESRDKEVTINDEVVYTTHDGTAQYNTTITVDGETVKVDKKTADNIRTKRPNTEDVRIEQRPVYTNHAGETSYESVIVIGEDEVIKLGSDAKQRLEEGDLQVVADEMYVAPDLEVKDKAAYDLGESLGVDMDPNQNTMTDADLNLFLSNPTKYAVMQSQGIKNVEIETKTVYTTHDGKAQKRTKITYGAEGNQKTIILDADVDKDEIVYATHDGKELSQTEVRFQGQKITLDSETASIIRGGDDEISVESFVAFLSATGSIDEVLLPVESIRSNERLQLAIGESIENRQAYTEQKVGDQLRVGDKVGAYQTLLDGMGGALSEAEAEHLWNEIGMALVSEDDYIDGKPPTFAEFSEKLEAENEAALERNLMEKAEFVHDNRDVLDTTTEGLHMMLGTDVEGGKNASLAERRIAQQNGVLSALLQDNNIRIKETADGEYVVTKNGGVVNLSDDQKEALAEGGAEAVAWSLLDPTRVDQRLLAAAMPRVRLEMTEKGVVRANSELVENNGDLGGEEDKAIEIMSANMNAAFSGDEASALWDEVGAEHLGQDYVESRVGYLEQNTPSDETEADRIGEQMETWSAIAPTEFIEGAVKGVQSEYDDSWLTSADQEDWFKPMAGEAAVDVVQFDNNNTMNAFTGDPLATKLYGGFSALVERDDRLAAGVADWVVEQDQLMYHSFRSIDQNAAIIAAENGNGVELAKAIASNEKLNERVTAIESDEGFFHETIYEMSEEDKRLHVAARSFKYSEDHAIEADAEAKELMEQQALKNAEYSDFVANFDESMALQAEVTNAENVGVEVEVQGAAEIRSVVENALGGKDNADQREVDLIVGWIEREGGADLDTIKATPYAYESERDGVTQSALFEIQFTTGYNGRGGSAQTKTVVIDGGAAERAIAKNGGEAVSAGANHNDLRWKFGSEENFFDDNNYDLEGSIHLLGRGNSNVSTNSNTKGGSPMTFDTRTAAEETSWEKHSAKFDTGAGALAVVGVVASPFTAGQSLWLTAAATGYGAVRSTQELTDMASHGENWKSLRNPRARGAWFELASLPLNFVGFGSGVKGVTRGAAAIRGIGRAANTTDAALGVQQMGEQGYEMATNWDQMSTQDKGLSFMNFGLGASGFATPLVTNSNAAQYAMQRRQDKKNAQQGVQLNGDNPVLSDSEQNVTQSEGFSDGLTPHENASADVPTSATANKPVVEQSTPSAPVNSDQSDAKILTLREGDARLVVDPDILESSKNANTIEDLESVFEEQVGDDFVAAQALVDEIMRGNDPARQEWLRKYAVTEGNVAVQSAMRTWDGEINTQPPGAVREKAPLRLVAMTEQTSNGRPIEIGPKGGVYEYSYTTKSGEDVYIADNGEVFTRNTDGTFKRLPSSNLTGLVGEDLVIYEYISQGWDIAKINYPDRGNQTLNNERRHSDDTSNLEIYPSYVGRNGIDTVAHHLTGDNTLTIHIIETKSSDSTGRGALGETTHGSAQLSERWTRDRIQRDVIDQLPDDVRNQYGNAIREHYALPPLDSLPASTDASNINISHVLAKVDHVDRATRVNFKGVEMSFYKVIPDPLSVEKVTVDYTKPIDIAIPELTTRSVLMHQTQAERAGQLFVNQEGVEASPALASADLVTRDPETGLINGNNDLARGDIDPNSITLSAAREGDTWIEHEKRAQSLTKSAFPEIRTPYHKDMAAHEVEALIQGADGRGESLESAQQLVNDIVYGGNKNHIEILNKTVETVPVNINIARFLSRSQNNESLMWMQTPNMGSEDRQNLAEVFRKEAQDHIEKNKDSLQFDTVHLVKTKEDLKNIQPSDNALIISVLPQGLLLSSNDFHAHPTDYSRRILKELEDDRRSPVDKTLSGLLGFSHGRILVSSIPQRCCGVSTHWNSVVANRLTLEGATQLDRLQGEDFLKTFEAEQVTHEGIPVGGLEKVGVAIRDNGPDEVAGAVRKHLEALAPKQRNEVLQKLGVTIDQSEFMTVDQKSLYGAINPEIAQKHHDAAVIGAVIEQTKSWDSNQMKQWLQERVAPISEGHLDRLKSITEYIEPLAPDARKQLLQDLGIKLDKGGTVEQKALYEAVNPDAAKRSHDEIVASSILHHIQSLGVGDSNMLSGLGMRQQQSLKQKKLLGELGITISDKGGFNMQTTIENLIEPLDPHERKQVLRELGVAVDWVENVNSNPKESVEIMAQILMEQELMPNVTLGNGSEVAARIDPTVTALGLADGQLQEGITSKDILNLIGENKDLDEFAFSQLLDSLETDGEMVNTVKSALKDYEAEQGKQGLQLFRDLGITPRDVDINNGTEYGMNGEKLHSWLSDLAPDQRISALKAVNSGDFGLKDGVYGPAAYLRKMTLEFPGVYRAIGEITGNKEGVEVQLGKESWDVHSKKFQGLLHFISETGMPALLHNDWGKPGMKTDTGRVMAKISGYEYLDDIIEVLKKFPKANIVLAHTGIGRFGRPDITMSYSKGNVRIQDLDGKELGVVSLEEGGSEYIHLPAGGDIKVAYQSDGSIVVTDNDGVIVGRLDDVQIESLKEQGETAKIEFDKSDPTVQIEQRDVVVKDNNGNDVTLKNHEAPVHIHQLYKVFNRLPNVKADLSWTDVAQAVTQTPEIRDHLALFMYHNQDKLIAGTDTVKPASRAHYLQYTKQISPMIAKLALMDNKEGGVKGRNATFKFLVKNYIDVIDPGRKSVAEWTAQKLAEQGGFDLAKLREENITEMAQITTLKHNLESGGSSDETLSLIGGIAPNPSPVDIYTHFKGELATLNQLKTRGSQPGSSSIANLADKGYDIIANNAKARLDAWAKSELSKPEGGLIESPDEVKLHNEKKIDADIKETLNRGGEKPTEAEAIKEMWRREEAISIQHSKILKAQEKAFDKWIKDLNSLPAKDLELIDQLLEPNENTDVYALVEKTFPKVHPESQSSNPQQDHAGQPAQVGERTSGGTKQDDPVLRKKIFKRSTGLLGVTLGGMAAAHVGGVTVPADVNSAAFAVRGAASLKKSQINKAWTEVYEGVTEFNIDKTQNGRNMSQRLDDFFGHLIRNREAFDFDPVQVFLVERLVAQFEADFNAIIKHSISDHRNLQDNLKNDLIAEVGRLQVYIDRVLGVGFASVSKTDARTKTGKIINGVTFGTLAVNNLSTAQWLVETISNGADLSTTSGKADVAFRGLFGAANGSALWLATRRFVAGLHGVSTDTSSMQKLENFQLKVFVAAAGAWVAKDGVDFLPLAEGLLANGKLSPELLPQLAKVGLTGAFLKKVYDSSIDASTPIKGGRGKPPIQRNETAGAVGGVLAWRMAVEILSNLPEFQELAEELIELIEDNPGALLNEVLSVFDREGDDSDSSLDSGSSLDSHTSIGDMPKEEENILPEEYDMKTQPTGNSVF